MLPREFGLEIPRELWLVAGDEGQMLEHRVFRCTGLELTRTACDLSPLDQQTSPQRPSRVRSVHGSNDEQPDTRGLRQAGTSSEFLPRRRQKDAGREDTHEKLHKPRGSEPGHGIEPSLVGLAVPEEQAEAARITHGHTHWHPTTAGPQREEHDHRGKEIEEPLAADAP